MKVEEEARLKVVKEYIFYPKATYQRPLDTKKEQPRLSTSISNQKTKN